jgi:outer membrane protein assembly factor BamD (BamD/ComL family)
MSSSISALSSNLVADLSQQQNPFQQVRQDFKQLSSALQSGNLSDAQSAYSSIQSLLSSQSGGSNGSSTILSDFSALGQALQSGNLGQAQSAFSQLQTDAQTGSQTGNVAAPPPPPAQDQYVPSSSQTQNPAQLVQQDYTQLASALQSGNLTDAQSAFSALQQELQTQGGATATSAATNSTTGTDPITNDFNALGQALASGNLTQAQSAFSQLQNDVQTAEASGSQSQGAGTAVQGHHHHHHHGGGGDVSAESTTTTTDTDTTTTSTSSSTSSGASSGVTFYG